jgi:hypothetical protein
MYMYIGCDLLIDVYYFMTITMPFRRDDDDVSFVLDQHAKLNLFFVHIQKTTKSHVVKPATCLCLTQATTWISKVIYRGLFVFSE